MNFFLPDYLLLLDFLLLSPLFSISLCSLLFFSSATLRIVLPCLECFLCGRFAFSFLLALYSSIPFSTRHSLATPWKCHLLPPTLTLPISLPPLYSPQHLLAKYCIILQTIHPAYYLFLLLRKPHWGRDFYLLYSLLHVHSAWHRVDAHCLKMKE